MEYISIENEEFRPIPGHSLYQISNFGRVKSFQKGKTIILIPQVNGRGYLHVSLWLNHKKHTIKVHKLVAIVFLGHVPDGTMDIVVDHINDDKHDNRLENLQLITQSHNVKKSIRRKKQLLRNQ